uniref:DUF834 domain-containing protein n=1 Tax=Oryza glumipatula TaxID=40148 RepID=A0A0D9YAX5_9ORYZ
MRRWCSPTRRSSPLRAHRPVAADAKGGGGASGLGEKGGEEQVGERQGPAPELEPMQRGARADAEDRESTNGREIPSSPARLSL